VPDRKIDGDALEAQQLADRRDDDAAQLGPRDDLLRDVREVLDDDEDLGARIRQLVLELARRVERIDVHHRAPGAQDAEQAHRVLEDVGHHQRDARAFDATVRLEERTERAESALNSSNVMVLPMHVNDGRSPNWATLSSNTSRTDAYSLTSISAGTPFG
jgi:hypothetical protein